MGSNMFKDFLFQNWFSVPVDQQLFLFLVTVWVLVWKGLALWRAARQGSKGWFGALLVINTLGILEILYIYIFSKKEHRENNHVDSKGPETISAPANVTGEPGTLA